MEKTKIVNVTDLNRKRSSLKSPEDMKKLSEVKRKSLHFLDTINEQECEEKVEVKPVRKESKEDFVKHRRESLKNEYVMAKELLSKKIDEDEDDDDPLEVKINTEHNKHISDDEDDDSKSQ